MSHHERRSHPRIQIWIPGLLTIVSPDRPELIRQRPVTVVDLSERGAMVQMSLEDDFAEILARENKLCRLDCAPSSGLPAGIHGRSVWVQTIIGAAGMKLNIGLFFENLTPELASEIRRYLAEAAGKAS